jgi:NADP-dependent 3-hydroxy acid dehydrogenase YdfG
VKSFHGKVAAVTGAGSGIGRALALELAAQGARLAVSDIDEENVRAAVDACRRRGAEAEAYRLDVADREAVFAHANQVKDRFRAVNLIVNNAGVAMTKTVEETSIEDYEWIMGINFWGVVYGTKAFLPHLIASGDGHVVNISSVFGLIAVPSQSGYNAAKFGVRGFTEALRQEMLIAGHPVGVSCVHPGGVKTSIARSARVAEGDDPEEMGADFERMARTTPEAAARTILEGVRRDRAKILIGGDARAIDVTQRILGSRYQGLVSRAARRAEARRERS